jgi:stage V sporulation protein R
VDFRGNRHLHLQHTVRDGIVLDEHARSATLRHVRRLWGYDVSLVGVEAGSEKTLYETSSSKLAE